MGVARIRVRVRVRSEGPREGRSVWVQEGGLKAEAQGSGHGRKDLGDDREGRAKERWRLQRSRSRSRSSAAMAMAMAVAMAMEFRFSVLCVFFVLSFLPFLLPNSSSYLQM
jgi:hypothetical protein